MTNSNFDACTTGRSAAFAPLRNAAAIVADLTVGIVEACAVAHQPAGFGIITERIGGGDPVLRRQHGQLQPPDAEEGIGADEQRVGPLAHERREGRIDLADRAGVMDLGLQSHGAGRRFRVSRRGLGIGIGRIDQHGNADDAGHQLAQEPVD
jgi:hypothetical protein